MLEIRQIESDTIFIAKAIGIVLVVAGHYQLSVSDPEYWQRLHKIVYSFHMPLFMGLSGYLFGKSYQMTTSADYFAFLSGKARRLVVPYATISLTLLVIKFGAGFFVTLKHPIGADFLHHIILNPMGGFSTFLWFIYALFVIFLFFPILKAITRNDAVLLPAAVVLSLLPAPEFFCLNLALQFLPYFTIGFVMARHLRVFSGRPTYWGVIVVAVFYGALSIKFSGAVNGVLSDKFLGIILGFSGSILCVFLAILFTQKSDRLPGKAVYVMKQVGIYSSGIYLFHTIGMGPVSILAHKMAWHFAVSALLTCLAGLVFPMLIQRYLIDPNPFLRRYLLGIG